jgi:hypothetical protein
MTSGDAADLMSATGTSFRETPEIIIVPMYLPPTRLWQKKKHLTTKFVDSHDVRSITFNRDLIRSVHSDR